MLYRSFQYNVIRNCSKLWRWGVSVFRIFRMSDETAKSMDAQDVAQMYKPTDLQIYRHTDDIEERI